MNDVCLNTIDKGCIWGVYSDWLSVSNLAKSGTTVEYLGNFRTWDSDSVFVVFHTDTTNYIIELEI